LQYALELSQNITFINATLHVEDYGRRWSAQSYSGFEYGISQLWFKEDAGIIAIQSACTSLAVAPDDWTWPWAFPQWSNGWALYTSNTTDHGWLVIVQALTDCDVLVNNVASSTIFLDNVSLFVWLQIQVIFEKTHTNVTGSTKLQFTQVGDDVSMALVEIILKDVAVAVQLEFSSPVDHVTGQSGEIPMFGSSTTIYHLPPDPMKRFSVLASNVSSFAIPAGALTPGAESNHFYAVVLSETSFGPNISVSVTVISPTTISGYDQATKSLTLHVNSSLSPQLFRIPYNSELLVVSTELKFNGGSDGNDTTDKVIFGAAGVQSLMYQSDLEMHVSPLKEYYSAWYDGGGKDYYLFVHGNVPSFQMIVRSQEV
jgi:hypothetical protein